MATLIIELDEETLRKVERAAKQEHVSVDRWASEHLAEAAGGTKNKSFSEIVAEVAGTIPDIEVPSDDDLLPLREVNLDVE